MKRLKRGISALLCLAMLTGWFPCGILRASGAQIGNWQKLQGKTGYKYVLDTNGVTAGNQYLIVSAGSGTGYALTNNGANNAGSTQVTITDGEIAVDDDSTIAWTFSGSSSGTISNTGNGTRYVYIPNNSAQVRTSTTSRATRITSVGSGAYRLYYRSGYYLRYNNGWSAGTSTPNTVYLFERTQYSVPGGYVSAAGNQSYTVAAGTSAEDAMAAVQAGVDVLYATASDYSDAQALSDSDSGITWQWVDSYDADTPGDYEVEILYNNGAGQVSLGTVTVTVSGWVDLSTPVYRYELDTDGMDAGEEHKYIIVASDADIVMSGDPAATVDAVIDGNVIELDTREHEYWFSQYNNAYYLTNGNGYLYHYWYEMYLSDTRDQDWTVTHNGSGDYTLIGDDGTAWKLYYSSANSDFRVQSSAASVRLFKYAADVSGSGYAKLTGDTVYTVNINTAKDDALNRVREGVTALWAESADGANATEISDKDLTWQWVDHYDPSTPGSYFVQVSYQSRVLGTVEVRVEQKEVASYALSSDVGYVYQNALPTSYVRDFNGNIIQVQVTYTDGTVDHMPLKINNVKDGSGTIIQTEAAGDHLGVNVVYQGKTVSDSFTFHVLEKVENDFPEYPDEGAVKLDKQVVDSTRFQETGVAYIELSARGIPITTDVDVILTIDLSNSMAWSVGGGSTQTYEQTKLYSLQQSIHRFAETFLADNVDNTPTRNTVSVVTFGGYDAQHNKNPSAYSDYADTTRTLVSAASDIDVLYASVSKLRLFADSGYPGGYKLSFDGGKTYMGNAGNTNYDYAFMQANEAIAQLKAAYEAENGEPYDESGREIYVLFMTDGAPTHFDGININIAGSTPDIDADGLWDSITYGTDGNFEIVENQVYQMGMPVGTKPNNQQWYEYIDGEELVWASYTYNTPGVAGIIPIGFDIDNGGFAGYTFTEADGRPLTNVLKHLVGGQELEAHKADSADDLVAIYEGLAARLKFAAKEAYFVDQMGDSFNLQMASTVTKVAEDGGAQVITLDPVPTIEIFNYKIWSREDYRNGLCTQSQIGQRYGDAIPVETVSFNAGGTEAYSNLLSGNILIDGVITARNFWYNTNSTAVELDTDGDGVNDYTLQAESFYWNIGTISTMEWVISYPVYLEGSMEGAAGAGVYRTNNAAVMHYINYLDHAVWQEIVSPTVGWKSAFVSYGFYLVDENGNPVVNQTNGDTGSFYNAIKVTKPEVVSEILLNTVTDVGSTISADANSVVPAGYELYDPEAAYSLVLTSGQNITGSWTITKSDNVAAETTYVTGFSGTEASNALTESNDTYNYLDTTVWFALVWSVHTVADTVVIDYGLDVDISVLENDMFGQNIQLVGVGAMDESKLDIEYDLTLDTAAYGTTYQGAYGTARVLNGKVRYTPGHMSMAGAEKFLYVGKRLATVMVDGVEMVEDHYFYGVVTVIPATSVYYEDTFLTFSSQWEQVGEKLDGVQTEGRPGFYNLPQIDADNVYGYDPAYNTSSTYSMGAAYKVSLSTGQFATVDFAFCGTGFDVVSLTSNQTGTMTAQVLDESGNSVKAIAVDSYFGYSYSVDEETGEDKWEVTVNDPNALYQVPLIQVKDLPYGNYTVKLTATYHPFLDHTGNGGYDLYVDAVRIYDPAGTQYGDGDGAGVIDKIIQDAYIADYEGYPMYMEIRNLIIAADTFDMVDMEDVSGIVFIDGKNGEVSVQDYTSYGPNNELYLTAGQAIAFNLNIPEGDVVDVLLGMKSSYGNVNVKVYSVGVGADGQSVVTTSSTGTLTTATDMYRSVFSLRGDTIVVSNEGGGILTLTGARIAFSQDPAAQQVSVFSLNKRSLNMVLAAMTMPEEPAPTTPPETEPSVPETTESVPSEPQPTESQATQPQPTETQPTEPQPTQTQPTEPQPTEPQATKPQATEPQSTKPQSTEPAAQETTQSTDPQLAVPEIGSEPTETTQATGEEDTDTGLIVEEEEEKSWWERLWNSIVDFFLWLFGWLFD